MNKIQCPNGHYYDADMFTECPHCKNADDPKTGEGGILHRLKRNSLQNLWRVNEPPAEQEEKTVALQAHAVSGSSEERTVGFFESLHAEPKPAAKATEEKPTKENKPQESDMPVVPATSAAEIDSEKTQILWKQPKSLQDETKSEEKTEYIVAEKNQPERTVEPVVGWLVCIKGKRYGECFTINAGKNSIGRSTDNRISIADDVQVSRSQHAYIIFEPRSRKFYLQPGNSSGLTYLNQQLVLLPEPLKERDEIGLNESKFLFIPLCNDTFSWESSV